MRSHSSDLVIEHFFDDCELVGVQVLSDGEHGATFKEEVETEDAEHALQVPNVCLVSAHWEFLVDLSVCKEGRDEECVRVSHVDQVNLKLLVELFPFCILFVLLARVLSKAVRNTLQGIVFDQTDQVLQIQEELLSCALTGLINLESFKIVNVLQRFAYCFSFDQNLSCALQQ